MKDKRTQELFENSPIFQAILKLALPTMIGQMIVVLYNMADTFYIGLVRNDAMLAAVTVCTPAFMFLSAISNLFGVGGASAIARALGRKDQQSAKKSSSFSFYGCVFVTLAYSLGVGFFLHNMVNLLGGIDAQVHEYACSYMLITVVIGGMATSMNALLAHLIRSEGRAIHASIGVALGGALNILLDPLFMFVIYPAGQELSGAATATALSNLLALLYFVAVLMKNHKKSVLRFRWDISIFSTPLPREILLIGMPACVMTLFENISFSVMDALTAGHGMSYQAGLGVAKKVNMLAHCIVRGLSQGVLPLIAYNYASGNKKRMSESIRISEMLAVSLAGICTLASLVFGKQLVGLFIHHGGASMNHGVMYLRILCLGCPFSALAYVLISVFQATKRGTQSLILALLRKGIVDIPLLFLFNHLFFPYGLAWATPVADILCSFIAMILYYRFAESTGISAKVLHVLKHRIRMSSPMVHSTMKRF